MTTPAHKSEGVNRTKTVRFYSFFGNDEDLQWRADKLFKQSLEQVNYRVLHENDLECIMRNRFAKEEFGYRIDGTPYQTKADITFDHSQLNEIVNSMLDDLNHGEEKEVYFYHSDHLGSASWITDSIGIPIQHLQYLPYGEPYINQHPYGYSERFTFTGKERDEETGYGYFGARYMDHELMTMWLSVDPMADLYPNISPYSYCMWNPVRVVDPNGMDTTIVFDLDAGGSYRHENTERTGLSIVQIEHGEETTLYSGQTSYDRIDHHDLRTIISFNDASQAREIYDKLKENGVQFEWNIMYLKDGSADLVTSGLIDEIRMKPDDYSSKNVESWRHYHPVAPGILCWMPSKTDQLFAQSLALCPSFLDFGGQGYDFAPIIKKYERIFDAIESGLYREILKREYPNILPVCY